MLNSTVDQRRFLADQGQLVLIAQDLVPAVRSLVRVAELPGRVVVGGPLGIRLVEHARLRDADPDRRFVSVHVGQERNLQCQRQLRVDRSGAFDAPEDQAPGERQAGPAGRRGTPSRTGAGSRPNGRNVTQVLHGLASGLPRGSRNGSVHDGNWPSSQNGKIRLVIGKDAKAGPAQSVGVRDVLAVNRMQQAAEKADAVLRRRLDSRAVKKLFQNALPGPCSLLPNSVQRTRPLSSWVRDSASGSSRTQRSFCTIGRQPVRAARRDCSRDMCLGSRCPGCRPGAA